MTDREIYYSSFVYLLHNITANLRFIVMNFERSNGKIVFDFVYADAPTELEKELAEDITSNIITLVWNEFTDVRRYIVSLDPLEMISPGEYLLYARNEQ